MRLKYWIKRRQVRKAIRNNAGRIASVAAAFVGVVVGVRAWKAMRAR